MAVKKAATMLQTKEMLSVKDLSHIVARALEDPEVVALIEAGDLTKPGLIGKFIELYCRTRDYDESTAFALAFLYTNNRGNGDALDPKRLRYEAEERLLDAFFTTNGTAAYIAARSRLAESRDYRQQMRDLFQREILPAVPALESLRDYLMANRWSS